MGFSQFGHLRMMQRQLREHSSQAWYTYYESKEPHPGRMDQGTGRSHEAKRKYQIERLLQP